MFALFTYDNGRSMLRPYGWHSYGFVPLTPLGRNLSAGLGVKGGTLFAALRADLKVGPYIKTTRIPTCRSSPLCLQI